MGNPRGLVLHQARWDWSYMLSFCSKQWDKYGPTQITAARGDESSTTAARGGDPMVLAARGIDSQAWTSTAKLTGIMTGITTGITGDV